MLKKCYCILTNAQFLPEFDGDVIGVDKGALICLRNNIPMKAALGDFDSINEEEKSLLLKACDQTIVLSPRKDVSDSEAAVLWAKQMGYEQIVLVSSMSGRFDHSYVNFRLVSNYGCELLDQNNYIYMIEQGTHEVVKQGYKYISFFAVDQTEISLQGFSYDLDKYELNSSDVLCLSNELLNEKGTVTTSGKLWCIQSNDMK